MIDAVARPPPLNRSIRLSSWFESKSDFSCAWLTFGTGTLVRIRKISRMKRVNSTLRRMSGARKALTSDSITLGLALAGLGRLVIGRLGRLRLHARRRQIASLGASPAARARASARPAFVLAWVALASAASVSSSIGGVLRPAEALGGGAGGGELVERGAGEGVGMDRHALRRVAAAEHLERHRARLLNADELVVRRACRA